MALEYVAPATVDMARDMAGRLAPLDLREIRAGGTQPLKSLEGGITGSDETWAYLKDGRPFAIAGIDGGVIWLLTARDMKQRDAAWFFARRARADLAERLARWGRLTGVIYDKNAPHKRLLEWLGFEFGDCLDFNGHAFRKFWRNPDV